MSGDRRRPAGRGLSTSASFLIVFLGIFVAVGSLYTVAGNTGERLTDAGEDQRDRHETVQLTRVEVTDAVWDGGTLTVRVNNTGDTTLSVPATDTVVDGTYVGVADYERVEVAGQDSALWRPGEQLVLADDDTVADFGSAPERVRVVTETGVSATSEVSQP